LQTRVEKTDIVPEVIDDEPKVEELEVKEDNIEENENAESMEQQLVNNDLEVTENLKYGKNIDKIVLNYRSVKKILRKLDSQIKNTKEYIAKQNKMLHYKKHSYMF
jgi:hypothetical protein